MNTVIEKELVEYEARDWEAKTVACKIGDHEYSVADLRQVFDRVCDLNDWKAPCVAWVPHRAVGVVCKAIEWFHGSKAWIGPIQPITGKVAVGSDGYAG